MPLWKPDASFEGPPLQLGSWSVYELSNGDRHLVGHLVYYQEGRVSSKIIKVEEDIITTYSGRRYKLLGEPGYNSDAQYTWGKWIELHGIKKYKDVSGDYL